MTVFDTQYTGAQLLLIRRIMSFKILRQYLNWTLEFSILKEKLEIRSRSVAHACQ